MVEGGRQWSWSLLLINKEYVVARATSVVSARVARPGDGCR